MRLAQHLPSPILLLRQSLPQSLRHRMCMPIAQLALDLALSDVPLLVLGLFAVLEQLTKWLDIHVCRRRHEEGQRKPRLVDLAKHPVHGGGPAPIRPRLDVVPRVYHKSV